MKLPLYLVLKIPIDEVLSIDTIRGQLSHVFIYELMRHDFIHLPIVLLIDLYIL